MKDLENTHILVVGDIMLDRYVIGAVHRISAEAPVPIVNVTKTYEVLGGCGNVAINLRYLGIHVSILASVGNDTAGQKIFDKLGSHNIQSYVFRASEQTTIKERIVAGERQTQMLRIDRESTTPILFEELLPSLSELKEEKFDYIIISDYAKGFVTHELVDYLKTFNIPIIADPKPKNIFLYSNIFMITPNKKEFEEMGEKIHYATYTLITMGRNGMKLFDLIERELKIIPSTPVNVYNTAGAGDVVVATISAAMAMGFKPYEAAVISNACAAEAVTHTGTCVVDKNYFDKTVEAMGLEQTIKK